MATAFTYPITDTTNNMVATDQIRQQIAASAIVPALEPQPNGVLCFFFTTVTFTFVTDLSGAEVITLTGLVAAHDGAGLFQLDTLEVIPVATLLAITYAAQGWMAFVPDEVGGPVPAYYDGTNWRRVTDGVIVS
jgi:hypothetical protein